MLEPQLTLGCGCTSAAPIISAEYTQISWSITVPTASVCGQKNVLTFSIAFQDRAGNPGLPVGGTTDWSAVVLDVEHIPSVSLNITSSNLNPTKATVGDLVTLHMVSDEPLLPSSIEATFGLPYTTNFTSLLCGAHTPPGTDPGCELDHRASDFQFHIQDSNSKQCIRQEGTSKKVVMGDSCGEDALQFSLTQGATKSLRVVSDATEESCSASKATLCSTLDKDDCEAQSGCMYTVPAARIASMCAGGDGCTAIDDRAACTAAPTCSYQEAVAEVVESCMAEDAAACEDAADSCDAEHEDVCETLNQANACNAECTDVPGSEFRAALAESCDAITDVSAFRAICRMHTHSAAACAAATDPVDTSSAIKICRYTSATTSVPARRAHSNCKCTWQGSATVGVATCIAKDPGSFVQHTLCDTLSESGRIYGYQDTTCEKTVECTVVPAPSQVGCVATDSPQCASAHLHGTSLQRKTACSAAGECNYVTSRAQCHAAGDCVHVLARAFGYATEATCTATCPTITLSGTAADTGDYEYSGEWAGRPRYNQKEGEKSIIWNTGLGQWIITNLANGISEISTYSTDNSPNPVDITWIATVGSVSSQCSTDITADRETCDNAATHNGKKQCETATETCIYSDGQLCLDIEQDGTWTHTSAGDTKHYIPARRVVLGKCADELHSDWDDQLGVTAYLGSWPAFSNRKCSNPPLNGANGEISFSTAMDAYTGCQANTGELSLTRLPPPITLPAPHPKGSHKLSIDTRYDGSGLTGALRRVSALRPPIEPMIGALL